MHGSCHGLHYCYILRLFHPVACTKTKAFQYLRVRISHDVFRTQHIFSSSMILCSGPPPRTRSSGGTPTISPPSCMRTPRTLPRVYFFSVVVATMLASCFLANLTFRHYIRCRYTSQVGRDCQEHPRRRVGYHTRAIVEGKRKQIYIRMCLLQVGAPSRRTAAKAAGGARRQVSECRRTTEPPILFGSFRMRVASQCRNHRAYPSW